MAESGESAKAIQPWVAKPKPMKASTSATMPTISVPALAEPLGQRTGDERLGEEVEGAEGGEPQADRNAVPVELRLL